MHYENIKSSESYIHIKRDLLLFLHCLHRLLRDCPAPSCNRRGMENNFKHCNNFDIRMDRKSGCANFIHCLYRILLNRAKKSGKQAADRQEMGLDICLADYYRHILADQRSATCSIHRRCMKRSRPLLATHFFTGIISFDIIKARIEKTTYWR